MGPDSPEARDISRRTDLLVGKLLDAVYKQVGAANVITATICSTTDNKPANVCTQPAIKDIQSGLPTTVSTTTTGK